MRVFYDRHLCRVPWPDCVVRTFAQIDADPTVYHTMNGPSEFHVVGSLKGWDITDRLHEIATPTLLLSGRYDEATPLIVEQIHERIPGAQWTIFEESSHMPHVEEPEAFLERVEDIPPDDRLSRATVGRPRGLRADHVDGDAPGERFERRGIVAVGFLDGDRQADGTYLVTNSEASVADVDGLAERPARDLRGNRSVLERLVITIGAVTFF